ncbi:MAG: type II toxin-antitoxin system death-on-curing family toxin [Methanotrichaceae archaeon]
MIRITKGMVISIHDDLIKTCGGTSGVLCEGTIDCLVDRINAEPDIFKKATWALYIARHHPFYDGQERTAFTLAAIILRTDGYYFERLDEDEIFDVLHKITSYECSPRQIEIWVKKKSRKMEKG